MQNVVIIWFIWVLSASYYAFQYILRVLPNLMLNDILQKFHIDAAIFGQYSGLYYIGYALAHLPLGFALDRFGTKRVLPVCVLLTVGGMVPLLVSDHWLYPCIGRIMLGVGSSAAILGLFKVIFYCFGKAKFTRMLGISVSIGLCGAIFGGAPVSMLIDAFGWQLVVKGAIVTGIMLAALLYISLPAKESRDVETSSRTTSIWQDLKALASNTKFFTLCILAGLMVGPLEGFADVWGGEFFRVTYGLDRNIANGIPSFIFWGMLIGSPILSYLCDKQKKYFEVVAVSALVMGICFALMLTGVLPMSVLYVNVLMIGIFCAYQIPVIFKISTYLPTNMMGISTACVNMIIMSFGYLFHSIIGKLMTLSSGGIMQDGLPIYSRGDFVYALSIIPIAQIIAAAGFMFIIMREKGVIGKREFIDHAQTS